MAALRDSTVVRVADLVELGLHRATVAHRCRPGGPWRSLVPGIVVLHNGPPSRDDRRHGALLHGGDGAVITGSDALEIWGMRRVPTPSGPVHLLVPADRRRTGQGLALVERTDRLPAAPAGRWPVAPLERAVLDFTRRCRDRDLVRSAIAEVVQRGRATAAGLAAELAAGCSRGSRLSRDVLEEVGDGVRSVAEARARELVLGSGILPPPLWNPRLYDASGRFVAEPDAWFDDVGLAWEIDSHEWHLSPDDHDATLERRGRMTAAGALVLPVQPGRLTRTPREALDELERTYGTAARRPRPPLIAVPARTSGTVVAQVATRVPFVGGVAGVTS